MNTTETEHEQPESGDRFAPGNGPFLVSGTALSAGTIPDPDDDRIVTPDAIEAFAPTLADGSMGQQYPGDGLAVIDHGESARDVVGEVVSSSFAPATESDPAAVEYEAEIDDPQLARSIEHGRLQASPRLRHTALATLETTADGEHIIDGEAATRMIHLSVEQSSRSPGSSARSGPLAGPESGTESTESDIESAFIDLGAESGVSKRRRRATTTETTDMSNSNQRTDDDGEQTSGEQQTDLAETEQWVRDAALAGELAAAEDRGVTVAELYRERYDIEPTDYSDVEALRRELESVRGERA